MKRPDAMPWVIVLLAAGVLTSCAGNDYYGHAPYKNQRVADAGLVRAQDGFARALAADDASIISKNYTAPSRFFARSMAEFVTAYAGYPTTTVRRVPAADATAEQDLAITCPSGRVRKAIVWGWFDDRWRAWPAMADSGRHR